MTQTGVGLSALFETLPIPPAIERMESFAVLPALRSSNVSMIGRSSLGRPCLLVRTGDHATGSSYGIEIEHLGVEHGVTCAFFDANGEKGGEGTFSVLRCKTDDRHLQSYFVDTCESIIQSLGESPTGASIAEAIRGFVRLFRALEEVPRKAVQGLWAEVFVIRQSVHPEGLLSLWHSGPNDTFDFSCGPYRLEVKSTSGEVRSHMFGLHQIRPSADVRIVVASLRVVSMAGGKSLGDLIREVKARVSGVPDAALLIDQQIASALGQGMPGALRETFDAELADASLRYFDASVIPAPVQIPEELSEVRFRVDMSRLPVMDATALATHPIAALAVKSA